MNTKKCGFQEKKTIEFRLAEENHGNRINDIDRIAYKNNLKKVNKRTNETHHDDYTNANKVSKESEESYWQKCYLK